MDARADYGLWPLVIVNTALFAVFAASFFHPRTGRDWRAMGAFTAFLVALFTEMYGIPLTVYLLSGWLGSTIPGLPATHAGGHLWNDLIGWGGDPHLSPFHLASYAAMAGTAESGDQAQQEPVSCLTAGRGVRIRTLRAARMLPVRRRWGAGMVGGRRVLDNGRQPAQGGSAAMRGGGGPGGIGARPGSTSGG